MIDWSDIVIVTGAGVSISAGMHSYREPGGIWDDKNFEKMNCGTKYGNYLELLKPLWLELSKKADSCEPTIFHRKIAETGVKIITQNVDSLHQKAGSKNVIELHGSLQNWRSISGHNIFDFNEIIVANDGTIYAPSYGKRIRPDIVLFEEKIKNSKKALDWVKKSKTIIFVGTSGNVFPIADWYRYVPNSILVDPKPWGFFHKNILQRSDEWALNNFPFI